MDNDQEARRDVGLQDRKWRRDVRSGNVLEYPWENMGVLERNVM
jgi:hypothetical protein